MLGPKVPATRAGGYRLSAPPRTPASCHQDVRPAVYALGRRPATIFASVDPTERKIKGHAGQQGWHAVSRSIRGPIVSGSKGDEMMMFEWILVLGALVWLAMSLAARQSKSDGATSAEQILQERLARGEIDAEEFQARSLALRGSR